MKYLNISIKSFDKIVKSEKDLIKFLTIPQIVELKLDGVKVHLFLKEDADITKPYYENWIVAYKGNILYPEEFFDVPLDMAKNSIGSSQYKFIWEKLKNVDIRDLPKGTLFFCEYLIKKPTLMSQYKNLYQLILLSYTKSKCYDKNGLLICDNTEFYFDRKEREQLAQRLNVSSPPIVFNGVLYPTKELVNGVIDIVLRNKINENYDLFLSLEKDIKLYWKTLNNIFLSISDPFGGKPEGFIFYNNIFQPLKIQQDYQLSKEERQKIKNLYKEESPIKEELYWIRIKELANEILQKLPKSYDLRKSLRIAQKLIKEYEDKLPYHSKRNLQTIKDDLFLTIKLKLIRQLADKWALVLGKFRVFTNGHKKMIDNALKKYNRVIIAIIHNKETYKYKDLRIRAIEECYKNDIKNGRIKIIEAKTGNILTLVNKALPDIVGGIVAGSDRVKEYHETIKKIADDIEVIEIQRDQNSISATKIINNIGDKEYFKKNTPKCVWKFYYDYLAIFGG